MVTIPYSAPGIASFEEIGSYENSLLISGSWPPLAAGIARAFKAGTYPQFAVLKPDSAGLLTIAQYVAGQPATAVCSEPVVIAADGDLAPAIHSGCFNPDALSWHSSYDTATKKANAFAGAPTPTQILVRSRD